MHKQATIPGFDIPSSDLTDQRVLIGVRQSSKRSAVALTTLLAALGTLAVSAVVWQVAINGASLVSLLLPCVAVLFTVAASASTRFADSQ